MRRFVAIVTALIISFTGLAPTPAFATVPADGPYQCESGSFDIAAGIVTSHSGCAGAVTVPEGVTALSYPAFYQSRITSISLPSTLISIGDSSLRDIPTLTNVTIPASVVTIGELAFGTTRLTQVTFNTPSSLASIGPDAFQDSEFTSITIPASVTSLGNTAFLGNESLRNIYFSGTIPSSSSWPWSAPADVLVSGKVDCGTTGYFVTEANTVTGQSNCTGPVVISPWVTAIGASAFANASGITALTIPDGVESIGAGAFSNVGTLSYCGNASLVGTGWSGSSTNAASCHPGPPRELIVTPGDGSATLEFIPGASGASAITNYQYSLDGISYTAFSPAVTSSPLTITGLTNGTAYSVSLRAVNTSGAGAAVSTEVVPLAPGQASLPSDGNYSCTTGLPTYGSRNYTITNGVVADGSDCIGAVVVANGATTIGNSAFGYSTDIKSIYIPESVTSINEYAFYQNFSIQAFNVSPDNAHYSSVGGSLLNKSGTTFIQYPQGKSATSYSIPVGVTRIEAKAFFRASSLTSVTIPTGVTSIGNEAFARSGLTSVNVPNGVTTIGDEAFARVGLLASVTLPNSLTSLGVRAFLETFALTSIVIPSGVTEISAGTFYSATGLTSITFPAGLLSIGDLAFAGTPLQTMVIPNGVTTIGSAAFYGVQLTSLVIPGSVTSIGQQAFQNLTSLTSLTLQNGIQTIGVSAFYGNSGISSVTIPDSVTSIGADAFALTGSPFTLNYCGNASLAGTGLPSLATNAASCRPAPPTGLTATPGVGSVTFNFTPGAAGGSSITGYKYSLDGTNYSSFSPALSGSSGTITGLTNGTTYSLYLKAVSSIGDSVASLPVTFSLLSPAYSSAVIGGVTAPALGASPVDAVTAGAGYTGTVTWSDSPTTFAGGTAYTATITLTPSAGYTFANLPANFFTVAGASATNAAGSPVITAVFPTTENSAYSSSAIAGVAAPVSGATPSSNVDAGTGYTGTVSWSGSPATFAGGVSYTATITLTPTAGYTFSGVEEDFFAVSGAVSSSNAANSGVITVVFPETGTPYDPSTGTGRVQCVTDGQVAGSGYFDVNEYVVVSSSDCNGAAIIPEGVLEIGDLAFYFATSLTDVTLASGITSIGVYAFLSASALTSISIPGSVSSIGYGAFQNATALTSVVIGEGTTSIGDYAFAGDAALVTIVLPSTVTSIGAGAFVDASSLTSISIPVGVTEIETDTFYGATSLSSVTLRDGLLSIGDYAFSGNQALTSIVLPTSLTAIGEEAFSGASNLASITFSGNAPSTVGDRAFDVLANGAEAQVGATATGFGVDGSTWNGLLIRRSANQQNNNQQNPPSEPGPSEPTPSEPSPSEPAPTVPVPVPAFTVSSRVIVSTNGQSLALKGQNLDSVITVNVGGKLATITSKFFDELVLELPATSEGSPDLAIVHAHGTAMFQGLIQVVKPYAQKRTTQVTGFKAGMPTAASINALKKSYLAGAPANVVSCVAKVASNASAKEVSLATKSAKATCQALTGFSSLINTVNVQVSKTGRAGSKLAMAVTFDRTLTGK